MCLHLQEWFTVLENYHRLNATISDLIMGNSYSFRVFSQNKVGTSETSAVTKDVATIQKTGDLLQIPSPVIFLSRGGVWWLSVCKARLYLVINEVLETPACVYVAVLAGAQLLLKVQEALITLIELAEQTVPFTCVSIYIVQVL